MDWLLLDVARRPPSGKNPDEPMGGVWTGYLLPPASRRGKAGVRRGRAYVHGSDRSFRKYVAIKELLACGLSKKQACVEVALRLGKSTAAEVAVIRSGFRKFRPPHSDDQVLNLWRGLFHSWQVWVLGSDGRTIDYVAKELVGKRLGDDAVRRFLELVRRVKGGGV